MDIINRLFTSVVKVWGRNGAVGTSWERLEEFSNNVDQRAVLSTGAAVDVSSSSADDADEGTGATIVRVYGLDANYKEIYEDITMNGQTAVSGTKLFIRVFGASVVAHGSGNINAGDIYVIKTGTGGSYSGGVPGTLTSALVKILTGEGSGQAGLYTVPAGKRYRLMGLNFGNHTQTCIVGIFSQGNGTDKALALDVPVHLSATAGGYIDLESAAIEYPEKTDIIIKAKAAGASAVTSAMMILKEV